MVQQCECCGRDKCSHEQIKKSIVTTQDIINAVNDYDDFNDEPKETHEDFKWISEQRVRKEIELMQNLCDPKEISDPEGIHLHKALSALKMRLGL